MPPRSPELLTTGPCRPHLARMLVALLITLTLCVPAWSDDKALSPEKMLEPYKEHAQSPKGREILEAMRAILQPTEQYPEIHAAYRTFDKHLHKPWVEDLVRELYQAHPFNLQVHKLVRISIVEHTESTAFHNAIPELIRHGDAVTQLRLFDWLIEHPEVQPENWIDLLQWVAVTRNEPSTHSAEVRRKAISYLLSLDDVRWRKREIYERLLQELSGSEPGYIDGFSSSDVENIQKTMELLFAFYGSTEPLWQTALMFCQDRDCFQALENSTEQYPVPHAMHPWLREKTTNRLQMAVFRSGTPGLAEGNLESYYRLLVKSRSNKQLPGAPDSALLLPDDTEAYLPLIDHAYQLWAMADLAYPIDPPILKWTNELLQAAPGKRRYVKETQLAILDLYLRSYILLYGSDATSLDALFAMDAYDQAPTEFKQQVIETTIQMVEKTDHADYFLTRLDRVAGEEPALILTALKAISNLQLRKTPPNWSEQAHNVLIRLSRNDSLGNYEPMGSVSIREEAWIIRRFVFDDVMPREEALTMSLWRNRALADIYEERYRYLWLSLIIPAALVLFRSPRKTGAVAILMYPIPLLGVIVVLAILNSLGHGHANMSGMITVLRGGLYIFVPTVLVAWCYGFWEGIHGSKDSQRSGGHNSPSQG